MSGKPSPRSLMRQVAGALSTPDKSATEARLAQEVKTQVAPDSSGAPTRAASRPQNSKTPRGLLRSVAQAQSSKTPKRVLPPDAMADPTPTKRPDTEVADGTPGARTEIAGLFSTPSSVKSPAPTTVSPAISLTTQTPTPAALSTTPAAASIPSPMHTTPRVLTNMSRTPATAESRARASSVAATPDTSPAASLPPTPGGAPAASTPKQTTPTTFDMPRPTTKNPIKPSPSSDGSMRGDADSSRGSIGPESIAAPAATKPTANQLAITRWLNKTSSKSAAAVQTKTGPVRRMPVARTNRRTMVGGMAAKKKHTKAPALPKSVVKDIFSSFIRGQTVSADALEKVAAASASFFQNLSEDLSAVAHHARRKSIDEGDIECILRRQRVLGTDFNVHDLVRKQMSGEDVEALIPVAIPSTPAPDKKSIAKVEPETPN